MCPVEKAEFERMITLAQKIGFSEEQLADLIATYSCQSKKSKK